jgi:RNA polymerase sigma factor (sigma-70 family)
MAGLPEDRALLDSFRRGEGAALAEVYRAYVRPLYAMISGGFTFDSGGQPQRFPGYREPWAVEGAVQETFARAFAPAARARYDGLRPYHNYLFAIARNLIVDELRANARAHGGEPAAGRQGQGQGNDSWGDGEASAHTDGASEAASPEDDLARKELGARCEAFAAALETAERRVFDARFGEGLSVEETARRLGVSEHQVKRVERRLKKRFYTHMKAHGYFDGVSLARVGMARTALLVAILPGLGFGLGLGLGAGAALVRGRMPPWVTP